MALASAMTEQIEDLEFVRSPGADAAAFFGRNHVTAGMHQLFESGFRRLAGRSDQCVFELQQAMGGGKTHTMIAFGLLVRDDAVRATIVPKLATAAPFTNARVVSFSGRDYPDHFVWGEVAAQLGRPEAFRKFWQDGPRAPGVSDWTALLGDDPTLILLDELPPYLDAAATRAVGGGTLAHVTTAALANLFEAARKLPRVCIVLATLRSTYEAASQSLRAIVRNLDEEARRQSQPITPVELGGDEIFQILKKRLFSKLPSDRDIDAVAEAFTKAMGEAVKAKSIAKSDTQLSAEIRAAYPFHPSIRDLIALFRNNEGYRQTRGLMQFVSRIIRSVWRRRTNDVHLIGLQHLDLNDSEAREEINRIADLRNAIVRDIADAGAAHAETIDASMNSDAATQVATLLIGASLSTTPEGVKGLTLSGALEVLVAPQRSVLEFKAAFDALKRDAWYLHHGRDDRYYFANDENLTKRIASEAERAPANKVDALVRQRMHEMFAVVKRAAYQEVRALPKLDEVDLAGARTLLILAPDSSNPPVDVQRFYESVPQKNNLCVLTGDGTGMANLDERARTIYAIAKIEAGLPETSALRSDLQEKLAQAELDFNATVKSVFNRVWYPARRGLVSAPFAITFEGNRFNGEEQVEKTLAGTAASKLILAPDQQIAALIQRAEEQLWGDSRRLPWADLRRRALEEPRWVWLPAGGLDDLRKEAEARGEWRSTQDGWVERGPFAKPATSVAVKEENYDDLSGTATLRVTALHAGDSAVVYWASVPDVSTRSTRLEQPRLETDATRLFFLAVDPSGANEMGAAVEWSNRLTITHQPRAGIDGRTVELKVVPRGSIRFTLDGSNPAEGTPYAEPIAIAGSGAVTLCCHAEETGLTARRTFVIPALEDDGKPPIDPDKPARWRRKFSAEGDAERTTFLQLLDDRRAELFGLVIEVGSAARTATMRLGSELGVRSAAAEAFVQQARAALADPGALVELRAASVSFVSGRDLLTFAATRGLGIGPGEVEQ